MTRFLSAYRLIPILLLAIGALFVLKSTGLVLEGGYTLGERMANRGTVPNAMPATATTVIQMPSNPLLASAEPKSWMKENFYPEINGSSQALRTPVRDTLITGSVGEKPKPAEKADTPVGQVQAPETKPAADAKAQPAARGPNGRVISQEPPQAVSASERALLERLQQRRAEIEARGRELDVRENLIKAAEKRLEAKLTEIKEAEARVTAGLKQRDDEDAKRFKGIVTMYETMKPRDAAKIFDRLDGRVLLEVASQINPRRMSDIMAQMSPESAEKLTVELASRATAMDRSQNPANLPKIEGRPTGG